MTLGNDVVITGMGIVSPIGCGEDAFWDALTTGRSGAGPVSTFDTSELTRHIACQVRDTLDLEPNIGRASQLAIYAAKQALRSANLSTDRAEPPRGLVVMGTTMGETEFIEAKLNAPEEEWLSTEHVTSIHRGRPGSISRNVQRVLGLRASGGDLYGACAAGNMAIAAGRQALRNGTCDFALVGGADGFSQLAFLGFMRSRVLASEVCRPFDEKRDGLLVGEGAAVLVLELASTAAQRGARVRAIITGVGLSCESYHPTRPHPDGDGLRRAIGSALADGGLTSDRIDYICAHGTGTPQNDAIEAKVMAGCFGVETPFSSIKALTGHPMGAASALETACCVLSLEHQIMIPTWNLETPLAPDLPGALRGAVKPATLEYVLNNAAGFGGYNASVILGQN